MNTKKMKILEILNGRNSDIDFVLQFKSIRRQ